MKKSNYRLSLEAQFKNQPEVTHTSKLDYKYEFLTFAETEYTKAQKDLKKLNKLNNKLIKAFEIDTKDGKKIQVSLPQRLQFLLEEPSGE